MGYQVMIYDEDLKICRIIKTTNPRTTRRRLVFGTIAKLGTAALATIASFGGVSNTGENNLALAPQQELDCMIMPSLCAEPGAKIDNVIDYGKVNAPQDYYTVSNNMQSKTNEPQDYNGKMTIDLDYDYDGPLKTAMNNDMDL